MYKWPSSEGCATAGCERNVIHRSEGPARLRRRSRVEGRHTPGTGVEEAVPMAEGEVIALEGGDLGGADTGGAVGIVFRVGDVMPVGENDAPEVARVRGVALEGKVVRCVRDHAPRPYSHSAFQ